MTIAIEYNMFRRIGILRQLGYEPDSILDIGAHHGNQIYPDRDYYLFEGIDYAELISICKLMRSL